MKGRAGYGWGQTALILFFFLISDSEIKVNLYFYGGTFGVCSGPSPLTRTPILPSIQRGAPGSYGQTVQRVQREEDVRLALEGARLVPQQLAALQVRRDVLHADGLHKITAATP